MANRPAGNVTLPLLDRLTYSDPKRKQVDPLSPSQTVAEFKTAVRRDLEWLLNTRRLFDKNLPPHVSRSVLYYGLPEYSTLSEDRSRVFQELAKMIETTIATYEPRLVGAKVSLSGRQNRKTHKIDLVIEGLLRMDPDLEKVSYDTILDLTSGRYRVRGDASGG